MKNIKLILTTAIIATLSSCVTGDDYNTPDLTSECMELEVTKDVSDITSLATADNPVQYFDPRDANGNVTEVGVIEAYITSSDEGGNFYKSISMVSTDGTIGFSIPVNAYNLYTKFEPGRKVQIKLDGLYYSYTTLTDSYELGNLYYDAEYNEFSVGRLTAVEYENKIVKSCTKVPEEEIMETNVSIADITADDSYLHKLIELEGVQFADEEVGTPYFDQNNTAGSTGTNHVLVDFEGNSIELRISAFTTFAAKKIPAGSGKIRGVLTKYNNGYQFMIRTLNDVKLEQDRFEVDLFPPLVGSSVAYVNTLNEPFTSYSTNAQDFPAYINDAATGSRYWQVKSFSGNKYIQMTAFGGTPEAIRTLFIVPVNLTAASTLSFKTKAGFNNGAPLKVYYSTDYVIGNQISTATLVDITSNFAIDAGPASGYSTNFLNSGVYNIPGTLTGNGVFIFEYTGNGNGGTTTTMQIDDIVIN